MLETAAIRGGKVTADKDLIVAQPMRPASVVQNVIAVAGAMDEDHELHDRFSCEHD